MKVFLAVLFLLATAGCGGPISAWQKSLEEYVVKEGNGDLNVLRTMDTSPSESDFSVIGATNEGLAFFFPTRIDANGVLLGHKTLGQRPWYVFLVGLVEYKGTFLNFPLDEHRLTDIRLIACSAPEGRFTWWVGDLDAEAVELYRRPQIDAWRRSHPSRANDTDAPTTFPTPKDIFRLNASADALTVVDEHSKARWRLAVEPAKPPPPPASAPPSS